MGGGEGGRKSKDARTEAEAGFVESRIFGNLQRVKKHEGVQLHQKSDKEEDDDL
jgi:hypothetical protein